MMLFRKSCPKCGKNMRHGYLDWDRWVCKNCNYMCEGK